jgi:hypothetical protein
MNAETKIDQVKAIVNETEATGDLNIVVLHRGWIFVGELSEAGDGYRLDSCRNVRKWASGGFGGLSHGAKSSGATLDDAQPMEFPADAMIFCSELPEDWDNV